MELLGVGHLWDAYRAIVAGPGLRETSGLVAKFVRPATFDAIGRSRFSIYESGAAATRAYGNELAIRDLYTQLHSAWGLHKDIKPHHVRKRADGRYALISFEGLNKSKIMREAGRCYAKRVCW
ncbi:hypothetical protein IAT38_005282 [Cryptococcus sp. DSM 104549]